MSSFIASIGARPLHFYDEIDENTRVYDVGKHHMISRVLEEHEGYGVSTIYRNKDGTISLVDYINFVKVEVKLGSDGWYDNFGKPVEEEKATDDSTYISTYKEPEIKTKVYEPHRHVMIKEYDLRDCDSGLELEQHDGYEIFGIGRSGSGGNKVTYVYYINNETVEVKCDRNGRPDSFGTPVEKAKTYTR